MCIQVGHFQQMGPEFSVDQINLIRDEPQQLAFGVPQSAIEGDSALVITCRSDSGSASVSVALHLSLSRHPACSPCSSPTTLVLLLLLILLLPCRSTSPSLLLLSLLPSVPVSVVLLYLFLDIASCSPCSSPAVFSSFVSFPEHLLCTREEDNCVFRSCTRLQLRCVCIT